MDKRRVLRVVLVAAFIIGAILLIVGGVLYWHYNSLTTSAAKNHTTTDPDQRNVLRDGLTSTAYKEWLTSSNVYQHFYFFDVQAHSSDNSPPTVKEVGPYVYRVHQKKTNIRYNANGTAVDYHQARHMEFVPHLSRGEENDTVTVPNIPAMALVTWSPSLSWWKMIFMYLKIRKEPLYVKVSVSDLLWGQNMTLWNKKSIRHLCGDLIPNDTWFGLMYRGEVESTSDDYRVLTGADDVANLHKLAEWNHQSSLSFWKSNESNQLNGTDGSAFEPQQTSSDAAQYVFDPLWCRSMEFTADGNESLSNITVTHYTQSVDVFNNSQYDRGFCTGGKCLPSGVMDATPCQGSKVPLMWSEPHFYNADPQYLQIVHGLEPNKTLHESTVVVEPITGSVISWSRKLQMNIYMHSLYYWPGEHFTRPPMFPLMWMNEEYEMSADELAQLNELINKHDGNSTAAINYDRIKLGMEAMMAVGGALVLISVLIGLIACLIGRRSKLAGDDDPLIVA